MSETKRGYKLRLLQHFALFSFISLFEMRFFFCGRTIHSLYEICEAKGKPTLQACCFRSNQGALACFSDLNDPPGYI